MARVDVGHIETCKASVARASEIGLRLGVHGSSHVEQILRR